MNIKQALFTLDDYSIISLIKSSCKIEDDFEIYPSKYGGLINEENCIKIHNYNFDFCYRGYFVIKNNKKLFLKFIKLLEKLNIKYAAEYVAEYIYSESHNNYYYINYQE
jgi:hypothetical protein